MYTIRSNIEAGVCNDAISRYQTVAVFLYGLDTSLDYGVSCP